MGRNWAPYVFVLCLFALGLFLFLSINSQSSNERSIVKQNSQGISPVLKLPAEVKNSVKDQKESQNTQVNRQVASQNLSEDERISPATNPFLKAKKERTNKIFQIYTSIQTEKRDAIHLQFVGEGQWSIFSDLQVSQNPSQEALFSMGPYHVSRRGDRHVTSAVGSMNLIYEENQKTIGVLTGRLVVKVKDNYDIDPLARDYHLKLENSTPEIRTAYLNTQSYDRLEKINQALKVDQRVERFYFEVVRTDLVKN